MPYPSNGVSTARRSGTRDSGSTSSTRRAASGPAAARAWRMASRRRAYPGGDRIVQQAALIAGMRSEALDRQTQLLGRRRHQRQARGQREPHPGRIGQRLAEHHLLAPGSTVLDQHGREDDGPQRPAAPLPPRQQTIDQQPERALELDARGGFRQLERLAQELARRPRSQGAVAAAGELVSVQPGRAEPVGQRRRRKRRQLAERADAQSLERHRQVGQRRPRAQQRHRERRQKDRASLRPPGTITGRRTRARVAAATAANRDGATP